MKPLISLHSGAKDNMHHILEVTYPLFLKWPAGRVTSRGFSCCLPNGFAHSTTTTEQNRTEQHGTERFNPYVFKSGAAASHTHKASKASKASEASKESKASEARRASEVNRDEQR